VTARGRASPGAAFRSRLLRILASHGQRRGRWEVVRESRPDAHCHELRSAEDLRHVLALDQLRGTLHAASPPLRFGHVGPDREGELRGHCCDLLLPGLAQALELPAGNPLDLNIGLRE